MVLSSSAYFIFLVAIFFLYWPVACFRALSLAIILFANYFFYAKWDLFYLALIPAASTCHYFIALALERFNSPALRLTLVSVASGQAMFLIRIVLPKKLPISDSLADNLVNRVFDFPKLYSATETLVGVYAYALQLYYDFSGYTDIAIGSALLLAIKLPPNFNMPYAAENIADFWRRWHISLSNWLRDYLYFSLPGLRSKSKIFTYSNLILTMLLGVLWHAP